MGTGKEKSGAEGTDYTKLKSVLDDLVGKTSVTPEGFMEALEAAGVHTRNPEGATGSITGAEYNITGAETSFRGALAEVMLAEGRVIAIESITLGGCEQNIHGQSYDNKALEFKVTANGLVINGVKNIVGGVDTKTVTLAITV